MGWLIVPLVAVGGAVLWMANGATEPASDLPVPTQAAKFDAASSFAYLEAVCRLGPRISGSPAMTRQQQMLRAHFEALGAKVELQQFPISQPSMRGKSITGANLVVAWKPAAQRRVLLSCHYCTRPFADEEPVERNRRGRFLGANDGASGVAFFMELGRMMPKLQESLPFGVDFAFFDAEEYILDQRYDLYFLGSEHFARTYAAGPKTFTYEAVVNFDMIGDKNLEIFVDQASAAKAGALWQEFWAAARRAGVKEFVPQIRHDVLDDHISFHKYNVPAIDVIDFDYPHWHRLSDTPDKCSGESLEKVARVAMEWLRTRS